MTPIVSHTIAPRVKRRKDGPALTSLKMTVSKAGTAYQRSVALPQYLADALGAALGNRADIERAEVCRDHHARKSAGANRYYVRWRLRADSPLTGAQAQLQMTRTERAVAQCAEMVFLPDESHTGWYHCLHVYPAEIVLDAPCGIYLCHPTLGCACPDKTITLRGGCVHCKHMDALAIFLRLPLSLESVYVSPFETPEARRQWANANIGRDFA